MGEAVLLLISQCDRSLCAECLTADAEKTIPNFAQLTTHHHHHQRLDTSPHASLGILDFKPLQPGCDGGVFFGLGFAFAVG